MLESIQQKILNSYIFINKFNNLNKFEKSHFVSEN